MITSPQNEKLKLVRRLAQAKARRSDGLFVAEGEDLLEAARTAGAEPVELLTAAGEGLGGTEVEPELLAKVSTLGSGTRAIGVWRQTWADGPAAPCVYLHGVSDPGNVGTLIRTTAALAGGSVAIGPGTADPFSPRAVRASMGSVFTQPLVRCEVGQTPDPRAGLVAHGGESLERLAAPATLCVGAEREGLPPEVLEACEVAVTIPVREGAESLNVAAAAAIALHGIGSQAAPGRAGGAK